MKLSNSLFLGLVLLSSLASSLAFAQYDTNPAINNGTGSLGVRGGNSPSQSFGQVKVFRCPFESTNIYNYYGGYGGYQKSFGAVNRNKCKFKSYIDLNRAYDFEEGLYILGFENSVYPGFVEVTAGRQTVIDLQAVQIPNLGNNTTVVAVRDFSSLIEQKKQMLQLYALGGSMNKVNEYPFGAYLGTGRDLSKRTNYSACADFNLGTPGALKTHAQRICDAVRNAKSVYDLTVVFEFGMNRVRTGDLTPADSSVIMEQYWVTPTPGDVVEFRYPRMAVSTPAKAGDIIYVFPGAYAFIAMDSKGKVVANSRQTTYGIHEDYFGSDQITATTPDHRLSCESSKIWRTEVRAFCTSDDQNGCNRYQQNFCESMELYLRDE